MTETGHSGRVQYELHVESEGRYAGLYLLCFLAFLLAVALLFVMAALGWMEHPWSGYAAVAFVAGAPIGLYFLLVRRLTSPVTIILSADALEVIRGKMKRVIHKDDILSFEAHFDDRETYDVEQVIIRVKKGPPVKLWVTSTSGKLKLMTAFRQDFERWAETHQLKRFEPWYRRKFW